MPPPIPTDDQLSRLIDLWHAGLEAIRTVLRQLEHTAGLQRDATAARDFDGFHVAADTRDRLTRSLLTLEEGLRPIRRTLEEHTERAKRLPGYAGAASLHQHTADHVARILATDRESLDALAEAEIARRAVLASLERGETTLSAYRRALAPPVEGAVLMDRKG
ncbi:MAG: hypothetical protein AMXMBFR57_30320 [Acidimicrobiia bacterium]